MTTPQLRRRLLAWFDRNRRDLPWRRPTAQDDPYRIWLAEIMLQQTRVPVAIPYYKRFLRAFPTVRHLARTRTDRVLRLWAGLGYYQRARNLHRAAKVIVRSHGGRFPRQLESALTLPGVGAYTARAVLSIAYQEPVAVVDGNVARVLVRLFARRGRADDRAALQPLADQLISRTRPGDFNQAMMELGATVCLPRRPRCPLCPLEKLCAARLAGLERALPQRRPARRRPRLRLSVLVVRRTGRLLLTRERLGLFSGLWHFPYLPDSGTRNRGLARLARTWKSGRPKPAGQLVHETTMRDLILDVYIAAARRAAHPSNGRARWVRPGQLGRLGVGAATRKVAALIESVEARA